MFGSELLAVAPRALEKFAEAGLPVDLVWLEGEYTWDVDRPSYYLAGKRFLVRWASDKADGDDWYGCNNANRACVLTSFGLPTETR
jgi:hypothetical protein